MPEDVHYKKMYRRKKAQKDLDSLIDDDVHVR